MIKKKKYPNRSKKFSSNKNGPDRYIDRNIDIFNVFDGLIERVLCSEEGVKKV